MKTAVRDTPPDGVVAENILHFIRALRRAGLALARPWR